MLVIRLTNSRSYKADAIDRIEESNIGNESFLQSPTLTIGVTMNYSLLVCTPASCANCANVELTATLLASLFNSS